MALGEEFLNPGCQCCKKEAVGFVQPFIWVGFPVQPPLQLLVLLFTLDSSRFGVLIWCRSPPPPPPRALSSLKLYRVSVAFLCRYCFVMSAVMSFSVDCCLPGPATRVQTMAVFVVRYLPFNTKAVNKLLSDKWSDTKTHFVTFLLPLLFANWVTQWNSTCT